MKLFTLMIIMISPSGAVWTGSAPFYDLETCQQTAANFQPIENYTVKFKECL